MEIISNKELRELLEYINNIPKSIIGTDDNYDFVVLYYEWRNGRLKLPTRCRH